MKNQAQRVWTILRAAIRMYYDMWRLLDIPSVTGVFEDGSADPPTKNQQGKPQVNEGPEPLVDSPALNILLCNLLFIVCNLSRHLDIVVDDVLLRVAR